MNSKVILVLLVIAAIGVGAVLLMQQGESEDVAPAAAETQDATGSDMKPAETEAPSGSGMKPVEEVEADPMPQSGASSGGSGTR